MRKRIASAILYGFAFHLPTSFECSPARRRTARTHMRARKTPARWPGLSRGRSQTEDEDDTDADDDPDDDFENPARVIGGGAGIGVQCVMRLCCSSESVAHQATQR